MRVSGPEPAGRSVGIAKACDGVSRPSKAPIAAAHRPLVAVCEGASSGCAGFLPAAHASTLSPTLHFRRETMSASKPTSASRSSAVALICEISLSA